MPTSARSIADLTASILEPAADKHRFVSRALTEAWPEIVGDRLARCTMPTRMKARKTSRSRSKTSPPGDVLEVVADHAVAVDLEYGQELVVERLNAFFGYGAVSSLKIIRKALAPQVAPDRPAPAGRTDAADERAVLAATHDVADDRLRTALNELGAEVFAANRNLVAKGNLGPKRG